MFPLHGLGEQQRQYHVGVWVVRDDCCTCLMMLVPYHDMDHWRWRAFGHCVMTLERHGNGVARYAQTISLGKLDMIDAALTCFSSATCTHMIHISELYSISFECIVPNRSYHGEGCLHIEWPLGPISKEAIAILHRCQL